MKTYAVRVKADPLNDGVELDGRPLNSVTRVEIDYKVNNLPRVTLHLHVFEGAIFESDAAVVVVPDSTAESLIALGWTPPDEAVERPCPTPPSPAVPNRSSAYPSGGRVVTAPQVSPWDGETPVLGEDVMRALVEFHRAYDCPIRYKPTPRPEEYRLRVDLLREEYDEYVSAVLHNDVVEIADALADMVYVIFGTALTYGLDLPAVLAEVHRSNMSKLGEDGKPVRREDGKVLKGPGYFRPNVARAIWPPDGVPAGGAS